MRKYLLLATFLTFLPALAIAAFNYIVDPIQYFRLASFYKPGVYAQERFLYPALIRHHQYDGAIIGTSTAMTIRPSFVNRLFGGQFIKLTMNGGRPGEQAIVLGAAFSQSNGTLRNVIWGIDPHMWQYSIKDRNPTYFFPEYLYKSDPIGISQLYLLSRDITVLSFKSLYYSLKNRVPPIDNDNIGNWIDYFAQFKYSCTSLETQVSKWFSHSTRPPKGPPNLAAVNELKQIFDENFDHNILPFIIQHPETTFYLYNPPYSRAEAFAVAVTAPEKLAARQHLKERLQRLTNQFPNVKYYDFEQLRNITDNLDNYYDIQHHSKAINDSIFEYMAKNNGLSTNADWQISLTSLTYEDVFSQCLPKDQVVN